MPSDIKKKSDMNRIIALIAAGFLFGACSSAFDYDRGNYDDSYYDYTERDVRIIFNVLEEELKITKDKFQDGVGKSSKFTLK